MVKFSRQLDAQLIAEWRDAFVNYRQLKKHVRKIKLSSTGGGVDDYRLSFTRSVFSPWNDYQSHSRASQLAEDEEDAGPEIVHSGEDQVKQFFEKLDEELEKVNKFYEAKEAEFMERGEKLNKQLQILTNLKKIIHDRRRLKHPSSDSDAFTPSSSRSPSVDNSPSNFSSENVTDTDEARMATVSSSVDELERNGVTFMNPTWSKAKMTSMRIDIPPTTPTRTISAVTSMIWEGVVNNSTSPKKDGGEYITRKNIQCANKIIRGAFIEFYRGLDLLNTYTSLNMVAFRKILKKFNKVSDQQESGTYLRKVKRSHFASSDKVLRLGDEVESVFAKHFVNNDRKKAMKFLKPQQPKESHFITFFVGLFTGSFVTLFIIYVMLAQLSRVFSYTTGYMDIVYPIFSVFALLSLHLFLYGCNIYAWRRTRINHNFIFEFNPSTALKHRDAFLISSAFMTVVIGAMVIHLLLVSTGLSPRHVDTIPGILLLIFTGLLLCPFDVCYRSTRYCFLRVIRNIILSPFYRVFMVDFFMADQLTSQIPMLRHVEFTACFFMMGGFGSNSYDTCSGSRHYKILAHVISFLPYYWRAVQCLRRYMEEGYDMKHIANAGKYVSVMVVAAVRMKYAMKPTPFWMVMVIIASTFASFYQLYWDFIMDWGFFRPNSKNLFLRNELILKNKSIYYLSIGINSVLRLAWIQTVTDINLQEKVHYRMHRDFLLASLEIIRRGHWNYYRLENEHLNNVGKFRAVRAVPLPFKELDFE